MIGRPLMDVTWAYPDADSQSDLSSLLPELKRSLSLFASFETYIKAVALGDQTVCRSFCLYTSVGNSWHQLIKLPMPYRLHLRLQAASEAAAKACCVGYRNSFPLTEAKMSPANTPTSMAESSPQEAFLLAMHECVLELMTFAAGMERRVPVLRSLQQVAFHKNIQIICRCDNLSLQQWQS